MVRVHGLSSLWIPTRVIGGTNVWTRMVLGHARKVQETRALIGARWQRAAVCWTPGEHRIGHARNPAAEAGWLTKVRDDLRRFNQWPDRRCRRCDDGRRGRWRRMTHRGTNWESCKKDKSMGILSKVLILVFWRNSEISVEFFFFSPNPAFKF